MMKGFCQCGCGQKTSIADRTRTYRGYKKGEHVNYIHGHNNHPQPCRGNYVKDYISRASKALGKPLPPKSIVHHHTSEQLVLCQNQHYHMLLHLRKRAYEACGHANWRKCKFCKNWDNPQNNMYVPTNPRGASHHRKCQSIYQKEKGYTKVPRNRKKLNTQLKEND